MQYDGENDTSKSHGLCQALKRQVEDLKNPVATIPSLNFEALIQKEGADRVQLRRSLVEVAERDPHGLERLIGKSDLCSISFLSRGVQSARSVGRIRIRDARGNGEAFATGFLVAPGLLLTNHHVLPDVESADLALIEFNYEHDLNGVESPRYVYNLRSGTLFWTDAELDFTLIDVAPLSLEGMPLTEFGVLPLLRQSGKALDREFLSIIQHPDGLPKQIAIRDSQVITLDRADSHPLDLENVIHYSTDTQPGSSGSPVLNDQWQVVALHHRGVPDLDEKGQRLCRNGKDIWTENMGPDEMGWVANEGIRVSAICRRLSESQYTSPMSFAAYHRVRYGMSPRLQSPTEFTAEGSRQSNESTATKRAATPSASSTAKEFKGRDGYNPAFLSQAVPLPKIVKGLKDLATLTGTDSVELKYTHFSVYFDQRRRCPRLTAVNIDGSSLVRNSGLAATWKRDNRIELEIQPNDDFYKESVAPEVVTFQRGHLVRRVDPSWGKDAVQAVKDTFHFTNAAPHTGVFNDQIWGNLEDYLLEKCDREKKLMTVFSGPVFHDQTDPKTYGLKRPGGPYVIPVDFWKVVVIQKTPDKLATAAFIIGQLEQLNGLEITRVFDGLHPYTPEQLKSQGIQTRIEKVEELTGISFGVLKKHQSAAGLESTGGVRVLQSLNQIII